MRLKLGHRFVFGKWLFMFNYLIETPQTFFELIGLILI